MVFHKKYFWFFFRWKEFVCETELKTLFQNLFSLSCVKSNWNQVKVFVWKQKKLFWVKTYFPWTRPTERLYFHMWNPHPKKLYFKENIFFFSSKKNLCSAEKAFYVWNRNKTFFSTVKPRESMFWTCETKKPFFQEKNVLFFLMCYNFFSMCETKRNYVFPLVKAKTFFFFFLFTSVKQS